MRKRENDRVMETTSRLRPKRGNNGSALVRWEEASKG